MSDELTRPCPDARADEIAARLAKYGEAEMFTSPSWEDVSTLIADRAWANKRLHGRGVGWLAYSPSWYVKALVAETTPEERARYDGYRRGQGDFTDRFCAGLAECALGDRLAEVVGYIQTRKEAPHADQS